MTDTTSERMAEVVAPIIRAIEEGIANPNGWEAPWHSAPPEAFMGYNPVTDRFYTGGNRVVLALATMFGGAEHHWATYKHWASLSKHTAACSAAAKNVGKRNESRPGCGGDCRIVNVRKGAKATWLFRPRMFKKVDETGEERMVVGGFSVFPVFHSGDVDGYEIPVEAGKVTPVDEAADVVEAFAFGRSVGAEIVESATAGGSYSPGADRITMPEANRWKTGHGCWSTLAHELTHWTGHRDRLARDLSGRFGDEAYAAEELVAELGAAFTLARLGRSSEPREDHAHYLASWLRALKDDPKRLWAAAGHAEKATDYVMALTSKSVDLAA